jgi:hypothetical protein
MKKKYKRLTKIKNKDLPLLSVKILKIKYLMLPLIKDIHIIAVLFLVTKYFLHI